MALADIQADPAAVRPRAGGRRCLREAFVVLAIVLLAVALRLYRLDEQSLWLDEFLAFRHLQAPGLGAHITLLGTVAPEQMGSPLYYILQYYSARAVGFSPERLRLLPVVISLAAIPLLYGLTRRLAGRKAARIAALCLALSPQHIWHAQELRTYELVLLLATISVWTFLRAYGENRRIWWLANLTANTLLAWSHLFSVLLILIEGLFLLIFSRRSPRRLAGWSAAQLLLLTPWAVWMLGIPYTHYFYSPGLSAWEIFCNIAGGDIVRYHSDILPAWKTHPAGAATARFPALIPWGRWLDPLLLALFTGAVAWSLVRLAGNLLKDRKGLPKTATHMTAPLHDPADDVSARTTARQERESLTFLFLLLALPGLLLAAFEVLLHRVAMCPMYSMYNQIALYTMVGAGLTALPAAARKCGILLLLGLYAYQLLVFLPEVTRTNWKAAAASIREQWGPDDQVLHFELLWPEDELRHYLASPSRFTKVRTFQAACDDCVRLLEAPVANPDPGRKRVWVVFARTFLQWIFPTFNPVASLKQSLEQRGLTATFEEFPGHYNVVICRVERGKAEPRGLGLPVPELTPGGYPWLSPLRPIDYPAVLRELGFKDLDVARQEGLTQALRESLDHWPLDLFPLSSKFCYLAPVMDLARRGHTGLAIALARRAETEYPDFGLLQVALAAVSLTRQDIPAAQAMLTRAAEMHRGLGPVLAPLINALTRTRDPETLCGHIRRLDQMGVFFAPALHDACCRPRE